MKRPAVIFALLAMLAPLSSAAQDIKKEIETRVDESEVPTRAVEALVPWLSSDSKVKWYRETGLGEKSYEAKFKSLHYRWSVEFDARGELEDIEVELNWKKMEEEEKRRLCSAFSEIDGFRLRRIQGQWTSWPGDVKRLRDRLISTGPTAYEVEFLAIEDGRKLLFEGLFDLEGRLLSKKRVVVANTDNLDLE